MCPYVTKENKVFWTSNYVPLSGIVVVKGTRRYRFDKKWKRWEEIEMF